MENLKNKDPFLDGKKILVALSGGVDSIVLTHYLNTHYPNQLRIIHCNHHLSTQADTWSEFCQNFAKTLNIPFSNVDLFLENNSNIEENARKKRYYSLSCNLEKDEVLCTAHHQEDQAETLLLQLFRGSGVAGLASMPKLKVFDKGYHYRPLLNISKAQILQYAKDHHLEWVEDDSNSNTDFKRNFLRIKALPLLKSAFQNLTINLNRSAKHQSETLALMGELAQIDIAQNQLINSSGRLNIQVLKTLKTRRIKNILRYQMNLQGFLLPSEKVMMEIINLLSAKEDAQPLVSWEGYEVRRFQGELYFLNNNQAKIAKNCPFHEELKNLPNFSIRYRAEGQRIRLPGKKHSQPLKKVLQEANIPPWERNSLKMYYIDDELRAMERLGRMQNAD